MYKKKHIPTTVLILYLLFPFLASAQTPFEELEQKIIAAESDSLKAGYLNDLAWEYASVNPKKGIDYSSESIEIATNKNLILLRSSCYNTHAYLLENSGVPIEAEKYYRLSANDKMAVGDQKGLAVVYSNLAKLLRKLARYDEGITYLEKSIHIHDSLQNLHGLGNAYNNLANILDDKGQFHDAIAMHEKALEVRKQIGDSIGVAYSHINIGRIYGDLGDYLKLTDYHIIGLRILEIKNDVVARVIVLGNLAAQFKRIFNLEKAEFYCLESIQLAEANDLHHLLDGTYQVLGEVHVARENFLAALDIFHKAYDLATQNQKVFMQIEILASLGACYFALEQNKEAEDVIRAGLDMATASQMPLNEFRLSSFLSQIYLSNNDLEEANSWINRSSTFLPQLKSKKEYITYYSRLIKIAEKEGDKDRLIDAFKNYNAYRDSVFSENIHFDVYELNARYESEKKENTIRLLEQQEEINRLELGRQKLVTQRKNYFISGGVGLFLVVLTSGFFLFRKEKILAEERRLLAIKETEDMERNRVAKDIHDDLGSGLSKIRFLAEEMEAIEIDERFHSKARAINNTAHELVDTMRDLIWMLPPANNSLENLLIRIREFTGDYFQETHIKSRVEFPEIVPDVVLKNTAIRNLLSVMKEIMQNVMKHSRADLFYVKVEIIGNELQITASDDGTGFDLTLTSGNGLKNIRHRLEALGGQYEITTNGGTQIWISVLLEKIVRR